MCASWCVNIAGISHVFVRYVMILSASWASYFPNLLAPRATGCRTLMSSPALVCDHCRGVQECRRDRDGMLCECDQMHAVQTDIGCRSATVFGVMALARIVFSCSSVVDRQCLAQL